MIPAVHSKLRKHARIPVYAVALGVATLIVDVASGPNVQVPIAIAIPVVLSGWFGFPKTSISLAIGLPALRLAIDVTAWSDSVSVAHAALTAVTRVAVLVVLAWLSYRAGIAQQLRERVKVLEGILPICSFCKRIRDPNDEWHQMEAYISRSSEAKFSHGYCPDCALKHFGESLDD